LDVLWALLLIGAALFLGGILLRSLPTAWLAFGAVLVVFGLGIPALVIDDHKNTTAAGSGSAPAASPTGTGGTSTTATGGGAAAGGKQATGGKKQAAGGGGGGNAALLAQGKQIFQQNCGTCHTLADAGTNGKVGPVLDQVKPNKDLVLSAVKNGGLGSGTMPANIVTGKDAQAVATYVSTVAGK
jgi:mono/diheme cytochrome c family protein